MRGGNILRKELETIRDSNNPLHVKNVLTNNVVRTYRIINQAETEGKAHLEFLRTEGEKTALKLIVAVPFACALLGFIGYQLLK